LEGFFYLGWVFFLVSKLDPISYMLWTFFLLEKSWKLSYLLFVIIYLFKECHDKNKICHNFHFTNTNDTSKFSILIYVYLMTLIILKFIMSSFFKLLETFLLSVPIYLLFLNSVWKKLSPLSTYQFTTFEKIPKIILNK